MSFAGTFFYKTGLNLKLREYLAIVVKGFGLFVLRLVFETDFESLIDFCFVVPFDL